MSINSELEAFWIRFLTDFSKRSAETNWLLFKNKIHVLNEKYTPTTAITERLDSPWFNIAQKRQHKQKAFPNRQTNK